MNARAQPAAAGQPIPRELALQDARRQVKSMRGLYLSVLAYVLVVPVFWFINWRTSPQVIWAIWPTLGWGAGLLGQAITVYAGRSFWGTEWEQRKVAELMAREDLRIVSGEKQAVQAQLRLLQAQIEPHFLFNTLATIQSLIGRAPERAQAMMESFIAYLRQSLSASRAEQGTFAQEFALLARYLELIQIRMAGRLRCTLELPPELADEPLAPMLLQPLVENAIKHGLEPKVEGGAVAVRVRALAANRLEVTVEDDGLGFGANPDSAGTGVGLAHTRERLALLYDGAASLEIADAQPGTRITLVLPRTLPHTLPNPLAGAPASQRSSQAAPPHP